MSIRPTSAKGMRDYDMQQLYRRDYILSTLRSVYALYGFEPLETPAVEKRTTLTEKYGEEGEKLIFNILKSGDFLDGVNANISEVGFQKMVPLISDKGLRYDLTIPLVRYIAMHQHALVFPFRRYQMQPVWRADRPQKGRYREFWQCDIDIVGSNALLCEAEILKLIYDVFSKLSIAHFSIQLNHRGVLNAISRAEIQSEKEKTFCLIVDKVDKIGIENVIKMLQAAGFTDQVISDLSKFFQLEGTPMQLVEQLQMTIGHIESGAHAIRELTEIMEKVTSLGLPKEVCTIVPTLARGLAYYTGMVVETKVKGESMGSLGGGGRYDCLGAFFGLNNFPGVGFSFGLDRLYEVMEAQQCFNTFPLYSTEVLLANMEVKAEKLLLQLLDQLRANGIKAILYPQQAKLQKQLSYANKKYIPYVILVGEAEYMLESYLLKEMQTGIQQPYNWKELLQVLKNNLRLKQ